ncbi:HAD-like protein [Clavulina sp. PMI_390]|nr:HAD-like protein [Clavulina sp. PMI_390]
MEVWADTNAGLDALRRKFTVVSLTNGSTRMIIDAFKRNGVQLDAIFTSDIIGTLKPNPIVYRTALKALQCEDTPEQVAMVAAHAYDLEAAALQGFKTIYVVRDTEDVGLDKARLEKFDMVIWEGGIAELARRLGAV